MEIDRETAWKLFLLGMVAGAFMIIACEWIGGMIGRLLARLFP